MFDISKDIPFDNDIRFMQIDVFAMEKKKKYSSPPGGLEPPTFRLTAERASRLRHGGMVIILLFVKQVVLLCSV